MAPERVRDLPRDGVRDGARDRASGNPAPRPGDELLREVARKGERRERARREGRHGLGYGLGLFGLIGWSVAVPTLLAIALGVWIDRRYPSPYSWTLMLMFVGIVVGCLNAWFWLRREGGLDDEPPRVPRDRPPPGPGTRPPPGRGDGPSGGAP
jgi:ATP synthase protein I